MDEDAIVPKLAHYLGEINAIHPFREGNGRTQRKFIEQLAKQAGHPLSFRNISKKEMTYASVYSMLVDDSKMCDVIRKCIVEYDEASRRQCHHSPSDLNLYSNQTMYASISTVVTASLSCPVLLSHTPSSEEPL